MILVLKQRSLLHDYTIGIHVTLHCSGTVTMWVAVTTVVMDKEEMLSESLRTLQRFVRNQPPKGKDDEPGPSQRQSTSAITLEPRPTPPPPSIFSSTERALSFMREIRRGTRTAIEGEQRLLCRLFWQLEGKTSEETVLRHHDWWMATSQAIEGVRGNTSIWCHRFICLADRKQTRVPTPTEKAILLASGLEEQVFRV